MDFCGPVGTTAQQPDTGNAGEMRYNSTTGRWEYGIGGSWTNFVRLAGDTMTGALHMGTNAIDGSAANFTGGTLSGITAFASSASLPAFTGTGALLVPVGTTAQQPDTGNAGELRYNTTTSRWEYGIGGAWTNFVRLAGDTMTGALHMGTNTIDGSAAAFTGGSFSGGTFSGTGNFTSLVLSGTGYAYANGAGAVTYSATVPAASVAAGALASGMTAVSQTTTERTSLLATDAFAGGLYDTEKARAQTAEALKAPLGSPVFTGSIQGPAVNVTGTTAPPSGIYLQTAGRLGFASNGAFAGDFDSTQHFRIAGGGTPTVSGCGTGATVSGSDQRFRLVVGTGGVTSCTINFGSTWDQVPNAPTMSPANTTAANQATTRAYIGIPTATAVVINGAALDSAAYDVTL